MESALTPEAALASLAWQIELGATEAIGDAPLNRYELPDRSAKPATPPAETAPIAPLAETDPVAEAEAAAGAATTLDALRETLAAYTHCELSRGARNLVFADGNPQARVMIIGEAPGREEDLEGRPFVGRAGQLLDRMLAAIGLDRRSDDPVCSVYITNVLPWRPPQNRDPQPDEIAMMRPFLARHVALVAPEVLILMGNISCEAGLGRRGITRLRGHWTEAHGTPALPMFHPAYILRNPASKREAWADLLSLRERLGDHP
ncbi:uracil-DNA glycosylase [Roseovarius autotrophicus]|uniref:uracil-DNA glycosylase n=1 Tax=Roseovarius autotrophicus TaxID=2824121 RepID=UPI0019DDDFA3|nr:uracil-DNA glycosylase [Roseovarius autotrophicus]MBE0454317.1 uracil-DNA glycosylase [Roseovarius sp.]